MMGIAVSSCKNGFTAVLMQIGEVIAVVGYIGNASGGLLLKMFYEASEKKLNKLRLLGFELAIFITMLYILPE